MATISKGNRVRQRVKVIEGEVTSKRFDEDSDSFQYLVSYTDDEGDQHERSFSESEIELVSDDAWEGK